MVTALCDAFVQLCKRKLLNSQISQHRPDMVCLGSGGHRRQLQLADVTGLRTTLPAADAAPGSVAGPLRPADLPRPPGWLSWHYQRSRRCHLVSPPMATAAMTMAATSSGQIAMRSRAAHVRATVATSTDKANRRRLADQDRGDGFTDELSS